MHLMGGMNERRPTGKLIEASSPSLWNCDLGPLKISRAENDPLKTINPMSVYDDRIKRAVELMMGDPVVVAARNLLKLL